MAGGQIGDAGGDEAERPEGAPWPPPTPREPPVEGASASGREAWWLILALVAGTAGVVGALLPAIDGQKVGDPASVAYRVGVPAGFVGGAIAIVLGVLLNGRRTTQWTSPLSIAAAVIGGVALLLTAALVFGG